MHRLTKRIEKLEAKIKTEDDFDYLVSFDTPVRKVYHDGRVEFASQDEWKKYLDANFPLDVKMVIL